MKEPLRALFISQEIYPYLAQETPIRKLNRQLPELCQSSGWETRTFMPKFGEINERRNQLHEVIRLSGMNIIIDDTDHPLLLKVASIQSARIQIYFIDNDDFFHRRRGIVDENGTDYADNDERCIFFARGVIETVKKLRWTPNIVYCSGWMSALAPLYLKKAYSDTPFFANSKIVLSLHDEKFNSPFSDKFASKLRIDGITEDDVKNILGKQVGYEDLMKLAIQYSDAVVESSENVNPELMEYAKQMNLPLMQCKDENAQAYLDFYKTLLL
ncbi:MAG: glycogen/starch synthase [Paludibacteraceae bacterium]|nr:glycogen/starch synthase [Paludibacteraceae bacterium]